MAPLIVLTCAGGKQVKHILPHLAKQDVLLRLIVNSESSAQRLKQQYPEAQVEQADLIDPKLCKHIARDATTIFHLGSWMARHLMTSTDYNRPTTAPI